MNYDVDYFIRKFDAIPDHLWIVGDYKLSEKCCAMGHCGISNNDESSGEADALRALFKKTFLVQEINDGRVEKYNQPTPKQRVLAALYDIKAAKQKEVKEKCDAALYHFANLKEVTFEKIKEDINVPQSVN